MMMYFKENIPILLLFAAFNIVILLIGILDSSIPNVAVTYIFLFNLLIFIVYMIWDYTRKRSFNNELLKLGSLNDIAVMSTGNTPAQRHIYVQLDELRVQHQHTVDKESRRTGEKLAEMARFSHDMKMPVTTMKLMIDALDGSDRQKLSGGWTRLNGMLNEILYLKRLPNIKNDLYIEDIDIEKIL